MQCLAVYTLAGHTMALKRILFSLQIVSARACAGTYFPPRDAYGRPGFPTVLKKVAEVGANLWHDSRPS